MDSFVGIHIFSVNGNERRCLRFIVSIGGTAMFFNILARCSTSVSKVDDSSKAISNNIESPSPCAKVNHGGNRTN